MDHRNKEKAAERPGENASPNQSHKETPSGTQDKDKGKGKSFVDNMWSSSKMAAGALSGGTPELANIGGPSSKSTGSQPSSQSGPSSAVQDAALRQGPQSRHTDTTSIAETSFKGQPGTNHGTSQAFDKFLDGQGNPLPTIQQHQMGLSNHSSQRVEASDGSAVVDLLNQAWDEEEPQSRSDEDETLSLADTQKLRDALFGGTPGPALPWDHLLNFTPEFVISGHPAGHADSRDHLGTADLQTTKSTWLSQWHDVLSAYTEEVWGDLGPLVAQARREIDTLTFPENHKMADEDGQGALGRLRMILAHVRGSA